MSKFDEILVNLGDFCGILVRFCLFYAYFCVDYDLIVDKWVL